MPLPVRGVGRHHVEVAVDEQRGPPAVLAGNARDHAGALGARLEDGGLDADVGEELGNALGGMALAGAGVITRVGRVDADEVGAEPGYLILGGREAGLGDVSVFGHLAMVACTGDGRQACQHDAGTAAAGRPPPGEAGLRG